MNDTFYIIMLILFIKLNTSIEDFISTINNPNIKYDFGHWVIYEMNIGSFTQEGTFNAAKEKLPNLKDLGIDIIWLIQFMSEMEVEQQIKLIVLMLL